MAPKVPEQHLEARRQQIIEAAVHCFTQKGFHQCTMQDICKTAQLSPGAVYRYFSSKEEIIEQMAEISRAQHAEFFATAHNAESIQEGILKLVPLFFDAFLPSEAKDCAQLELMLLTESLNNPRLRTILIANHKSVLDALEAIIAKGQQQGEIKPDIDPRTLAQAMFALHQGLTSQLATQHDIDVSAYQNIIKEMISSMFIDHNNQ